MTLQCINCNYRFEPKAGRVPKKCPYCDSETGLEKPKSAQDLIDEVSALQE